ncbi:MAG: Crp/Fnr family transcriptional regulator [Gammaproteobacteria bacterium]|nr:Crp/Fnr family transcriptional regulator [Gammaproteobacteria bacterium]MBU1724755.1 Crp/Fnr family transcriptional regulator [Gammaproteobacteria bacterium]MBU2005762.1 Crp/Fnr family transcriptional regulator [Gammaproteobacteria bacterium]
MNRKVVGVNSDVKCLNVRWEGRAHCEKCAIRKHTLFAELDVVAYEPLLRPIQQYCFPATKLIYAQGVMASDVFVVRKGLLKLEETLHDGTQRIVRLVEPGHVAGTECLLDHQHHYEHSAVALRETEVCQIPSSILHRLAGQKPEFFETLMEHWHRQLHSAEQIIVEFSTGTVRERVARIMLKLIALAEREHKSGIQVPTVRDMSAMTGVTRESISRVMAEFKRSSLLVKVGPNRMQYDLAGLQGIAELEFDD